MTRSGASPAMSEIFGPLIRVHYAPCSAHGSAVREHENRLIRCTRHQVRRIHRSSGESARIAGVSPWTPSWNYGLAFEQFYSIVVAATSQLGYKTSEEVQTSCVDCRNCRSRFSPLDSSTDTNPDIEMVLTR